MLNIDIDTGGTMTDGLVSGDAPASGFRGVFSVKVETTPHDVTLSFLEILEAVRGRIGAASLRDLLDQVALIRWSSTITSNVLAQKSGPRLGLLVSAGHEDDLYTSPEEAATVVGPLIDRANITGVAADASEDEVRTAVKGLFDQGIRRINISLQGAFEDNSGERKIVALIDAQYPDHYLGSIPALPAQRDPAAARRRHAHVRLADQQSTCTPRWPPRSTGPRRPSNRSTPGAATSSSGTSTAAWPASARPTRSTPSSPDRCSAPTRAPPRPRASATRGCWRSTWAGRPPRCRPSRTGAWSTARRATCSASRCVLNLPLLRSTALGGGWVARVDGNPPAERTGSVTLGPDSMGAAPGPACYGLGGRKATMTDAFVVLGYLSPTAFLGVAARSTSTPARAAIDGPSAPRSGSTPRTPPAASSRPPSTPPRSSPARRRPRCGWDPADVSRVRAGRQRPAVRHRGRGAARGVHRAPVRLRAACSPRTGRRSPTSSTSTSRRWPPPTRPGPPPRGCTTRPVGTCAVRASTRTPRRCTGRSAGPTATAAPATARSTEPSVPALRASSGSPPVPRSPRLDKHAPDTRPARPHAGRRARRACRCAPGRPRRRSRLDGPVLVDGGAFTWLVSEGWSLAIDEHGDAVADPDRRSTDDHTHPRRRVPRPRPRHRALALPPLRARPGRGAGELQDRAAASPSATPARSTRRSSTGRFTFAPDPDWVRIVEFYCPGCGARSRPSTSRRATRSRTTSRSTSTPCSASSPPASCVVDEAGKLEVTA